MRTSVLLLLAMAITAGCKSNAPRTVYVSDFSHPIDPHWNLEKRDRTPTSRPFLGPLANDTATLTLTHLPPHQLLHVSMDIFILDTWDGLDRSPIVGGRGSQGPDLFMIDVVGGPNLVRTTFSNLADRSYFTPIARFQNYPSPIPSRPNPSRTGAAAVNSLGYLFRFRDGETMLMDSTYHLEFTLPHQGDAFAINLGAAGLIGVGDESWGVAAVTVDTRPAEPAPPVVELQHLYDTAVGPDAVAANQAFWRLVAAGDAAVAMIEKSGRGAGVNKSDLERLLRPYAADNADVGALANLIAAGPAAEPALREIAAEHAELAWPVEKTLRETWLQPIESTSGRRIAADARLLSVIGTPRARKVAQQLAARPRASSDEAADWKDRFDAAYQLQPGRSLRYIPPGTAGAEREAYLLAAFQECERLHISSAGYRPPLPKGRPMLVRTRDRIGLETGASFAKAGKGLSHILDILALQGSKSAVDRAAISVAPELEDLDLPGDWVIAHYAPRDRVLRDLADIVREQTGRPLVFRTVTAERQVPVARGNYEFHPPLPREAKDVIHLYSDTRDEQVDLKDTNHEPLKNFLSTVGEVYGLPVINHTAGSNPTVDWYIHGSSAFMNEPKRQQFLKNLQTQTGLSFTPESRTVPMVEPVLESPAR